MTVRCYPWVKNDRIALVGDAAHAVVPFYGQGMNAAFEDCIVLNQCILEHAPDWRTAFTEYDRIRRQHVDVLADLAIQNFIEMRDHVASGSFRTKKKIEQWLCRDHCVFPPLNRRRITADERTFGNHLLSLSIYAVMSLTITDLNRRSNVTPNWCPIF